MARNNRVVLETKEEKAKRKILEVIEECTELTILLREEPLRMVVSLDNEIMTNIIKMLIMEGLLNAVSIQPYAKVKNQQVVDKQPSTENTRKSQTTKDKILLFMQQETRTLSNAEISAGVGSNISPQNLAQNLALLYKQGKIAKVARGYWRVKGVEGEIPTTEKEHKIKEEKVKEEEVKEPEETRKEEPEKKEETKKQEEKREQGGEETKEQTEKQENSNITEQQVLDLFQQTGWQMTQEEVAKKLKVEPEAVVEVLNILMDHKKLQKEGENYKIYKSPFGIFEDETYRVLLDYIMTKDHFIVMNVKAKFPQETEKFATLLNEMGSKHLKEHKDQNGCYSVYLKSRILYYVLTHGNSVQLSDIKHAFPSESSQTLSNAMNAAIHNNQMKRNEKNKYEVLKM